MHSSYVNSRENASRTRLENANIRKPTGRSIN
jgi:hypothetical protein